PVIERIRSIVVEETESNARLAEQEWQRITRRYGIKAFAAGPNISLRPTSLGVEVVVRYITHAHERHEVRARLNQAVVELLHGRRPAADAPKTLAATSCGKAD